MNLDRVIVALSLIGLAGCAVDLVSYAEENDSKHYSAPLSFSSGRAIVNVIWVPAERMREYCGPDQVACARPVSGEWLIYTEKPRSWNNTARLRRLGHEVAHALGSRHE